MNTKKIAKKGFSLIELIIVIAVMAVLVGVLAPSLLQYVEKTRKQKDVSAMSEVVSAVAEALADQNVYDEVLAWSTKHNYACYVDSNVGADGAAFTELSADGAMTLEGAADTEVEGIELIEIVKDVNGDKKYDGDLDQYTFTDDVRIKDEEEYTLTGEMRGLTITFHPENATGNKATYIIGNAIINDGLETAKYVTAYNSTARSIKYYSGKNHMGDMATAFTAAGEVKLSALASLTSDADAKVSKYHYLYNAVRTTVGDSVDITSQTYRKSNYTIFIRMGSNGGNLASAQDAIKVYGQWNGTNLDEIVEHDA